MTTFVQALFPLKIGGRVTDLKQKKKRKAFAKYDLHIEAILQNAIERHSSFREVSDSNPCPEPVSNKDFSSFSSDRIIFKIKS